MNLFGAALAGIYVLVATRLAFAAAAHDGDSAETEGEITCAAGQSAVSQPDTTVKVTCTGTSASERASEAPKYDIYLDANCSRSGKLSDVCPGATASTELQDGGDAAKVDEGGSTAKTIVTLRFPQLPASQQVVCVKCSSKAQSNKECKAVITVAAALPQGPQACAVEGTSITLEINKAGGGAQFKCGNDRTLEPTEPTKAYADDCGKVETLKDMTRSDVSEGGYVTVKAAKLKKKKLCYLCQPKASVPMPNRAQDNPCKVYVQISGSTKFSSSVFYGLALPCLAAMLRLT